MQQQSVNLSAATSRAVQLESFGGPEVLNLLEVPAPQAGSGQIRVRVTAAGLNPMDWWMERGNQAHGVIYIFNLSNMLIYLLRDSIPIQSLWMLMTIGLELASQLAIACNMRKERPPSRSRKMMVVGGSGSI